MEANLQTKLPQEGTSVTGESFPESNSGCPTVSGGGITSPTLEKSNTNPKNKETKKYVQQTFHPSLFIRPRSTSDGNLPRGNTVKVPQDGQNEQKKDTDLLDWQRVPINRNPNKKRKLSNQQSPEGVPTSNMFAGLPLTDKTQEANQPREKKLSKPPPIILYGVDDINKLTQFLETAAERSRFNFKIVNKNQLRIMSEDVDVYKCFIAAVREKGLIGHTFSRKEERSYRLVIRNLHHTTPHDAIKAAFHESGNTVVGEIINARFGPDKKPTSTFFVNLQPGSNNKAAKQIRNIYHQIVTIEDPKKKTTIVQCQRCQQYGHTKNYCMRPHRCLKCADSHPTKNCPKIDRTTPATCALCLGSHPSNYKGCEVYKEILARKTQQRSHSNVKKHTTQAHITTRRCTPQKELTTNLTIDNDKTDKRYSEVLKSLPTNKIVKEQPHRENHQELLLLKKIEEIYLKQAEKIDIILQQMSNMLGLLTTLVNKISSC